MPAKRTPIATVHDTLGGLTVDLVVISAVSPERLTAVGRELARLAREVPVALAGAGATARLANRIGAILLDNAVIGEECLVAAGALVPVDFVAPPRVLVRGSPAKVVRDLTEEEWTLGRRLAERYVGVARDHEREDQG